MNASSQTHTAAHAAEPPDGQHPLPASTPVLQAATAVISASMEENGGALSAEQIAEAEQTASILFDAANVEAAVSAAREQARTECAAELAEVREQLAAMAGARRQRDAVLRLCEGRKGDDLLLVSVIAAAAECGTTPYDAVPMTLAWTRRAHVPDAHTTHQQVVVECVSSYGGRADLVIEGDDRMALGSLLDAEARDIRRPCPTPDCGTYNDLDASDPAMFGWSRLQVAHIGQGARWYCSDMCVFDALARAGHELAADDQAAAVDPDQQASRLPYGDPLTDEPTDDGARCAGCGCTDNAACSGGCVWVPNAEGIELCSACATPTELAAAGWAVPGE